ncbi:stabilizer of axonemal microtubules 5 isoform X2 [Pezoporus occidentalis]|uniref:stabilizer of axonemal microtubules 5 isoform X2 n=1 Tax=Pezoporus occidentalis TaxID=407982 RepID=UPI002F907058
MAACAVPLIPAPLTGPAFLKATHARLGDERWALGSAWKSLSHTHFPPRWGVHRRSPVPPPRSGRVLGSAWGGGDPRSETHRAFPERPLRAAAPVVPREPMIRMHTDPRICVRTSETRERFCPQPVARRAAVPTGRGREDNVPCGDREKIGLLPSIYTTSYPGHEVQPAARPWHSHRRCDPTIKGDGQSYYHSSYQAQFKGEWSPPAKPSEKRTSIKFGDPRISGSMSEQKHAYSAPDKRTHRAYDKEHAASQIQHVNVQLGDGCTRFSTSTSEQFPVYNVEPVTMVHPNQYASSIPRGDEDPERNRALASTTTTQLSYPETACRNLPAKPDLLLHKHPTKLCLGDEHPSSRLFSTTQQSDYQPPQQSERVVADSRSHRESHIPFNYHDECSVTTMKATLVPHRQQKQRPSEEMLQQIKYSHLGLPWRAQDLFRTEQKDQFTPKFRRPADIQKANFQVSCVPLGTLKRYCPQRKVHFAL